MQLKYDFKGSSAVFFAYSKSHNSKKRDFAGRVNGVDFFVSDFSIRHRVDFFQLGYERQFSRTVKNWKYHFGAVLANSSQQEISIESYFNQVVAEERNPAEQVINSVSAIPGPA